MIYESPFPRFLSAHEMIAVEGLLDLLVRPPAMPGVNLVQAPLGLDDVLRMPLDIGHLALKAPGGLVNHDAGVG